LQVEQPKATRELVLSIGSVIISNKASSVFVANVDLSTSSGYLQTLAYGLLNLITNSCFMQIELFYRSDFIQQ
jgi:hypothetical protein